jgi:hypothetical protein
MPTRSASGFAVAALALAITYGLASGQEESRVVVARSASPAAVFAARPANASQFRTLPANADLYSGDLLVGLPGGALTSANRAVTVKSLADYDSRSEQPIFEAAIVLHDSKEIDLDLTLDRGRVDITNVRSMGPATVRARFWDQSWKIVLDSPNTRVAIELIGRWPSGARFKPLPPSGDPAKAPAPAASVVLLLLSGSATVDVGGVTLALKAPPGPAQLTWNSLAGARPQPLKLEKLPDWADPEAAQSADAKRTAAALEKFRSARADDPAKAIETFLASADPIDQRIALVTLGALDDIETLGKSLVAARSLDQWDFGITVLRHWLGRSRGQDQRYYEILRTTRGYTPGQAQTIVQLLFGFSAEDLLQPETYEVLIDYLIHEKPAIRNLAAWHLVRLVPQGKSIPHKPNGTLADAQATYEAWKKLIPRGELPPPAKKE